MKRKVIKQGNGTLTITLPKQWTKTTGLKGGDEIEIVERGNELSVTSKSERQGLKAKFDFTDFKSSRAVKWVLSALHKSGFDEMELIYGDSKTLKVIQDQVRDLYTGFAIMEQSKKRVVLKAISKDDYSELETSLRRAFVVTLSLADALAEKLNSGDFSNFSELSALEKSNNQFTNFCERLLVKKGYAVPEKTCFKYLVVWNIEKVCDCYKDFCEFIENEKLKSMSKELVALYNDVLAFFRKFYEVIYNFDIAAIDKLHEEEKMLSSKLNKYSSKNLTEQKIVFILSDILERVMNFSGPIVALNI
jgi:phosphate uptake regulator